MSEFIIASVSFDKEVLFMLDTYRAELLRRDSKATTRSHLVNAALLEFLHHRREEEAAQGGDGGKEDSQ